MTELPLRRGETKEDLLDELVPVIFDEEVLPLRFVLFLKVLLWSLWQKCFMHGSRPVAFLW